MRVISKNWYFVLFKFLKCCMWSSLMDININWYYDEKYSEIYLKILNKGFCKNLMFLKYL